MTGIPAMTGMPVITGIPAPGTGSLVKRNISKKERIIVWGLGSGSFARVELLYVLGREAPNHDVHGTAERTK